MKHYWFSFSYLGTHRGVCLVEAMTDEEAYDKIFNLKLAPIHDDISGFEIADISKEHPSLEFNRLYSSEEMIAFGYELTEEE